MIFKNEKHIIQIIKYTPSLFIIILSAIIISILYLKNNETFQKEKRKIQQAYIEKNKQQIKEQVHAAYNYIQLEKQTTEKQLKEALKEALLNAHAIALSIYKNNPHKSSEELKKLIMDALRPITFNNGRGYFFIYEKTGHNVMLPYSKELEGKDFINHQDAKGTYIIQEVIEKLSKKEQTFYEWYWFKPNDTSQQKRKIGYFKNFEPLDWFIGTGEYIEDFEKEVQTKVLKQLNAIRFGKNGYIFTINYDTIYLSHIRSSYIGKSALQNNDTIDIQNVIDELIKIAKKGEGYYSYVQNAKPDNNESIKKISYVKGLQDWQWLVGTGFYTDDLNKEILEHKMALNKEFETNIQKILELSFVLTFFALLLSLYFSKLLQEKFKKYSNEIQAHLHHNERQQSLLSQQTKMAAMGEMIGNIAHQWRQPLSTITSSSTGMQIQKELDLLKDSDLHEGLQSINNSAQYLSKTIDDFRNFFKETKEKNNFNLNHTIEQALTLMSAQFKNNHIRLIKNIDDITICNYENELVQVIINLLNNARDEFLKVETPEKKFIFIDVFKEKNEAVITIKDSAGGIPKDIIDRIFEPYFTTKHQSQGTGIGLYMSQEIIFKNMEGNMSVTNSEYSYENRVYKGALFEIRLPIKC